ncbi:T9SS type A sorting domain-containing protein [Hymenobacter telluris]|uniref:T9SS type A sorting domain-containing protein n=1 Tax=Hymenobacter telluris TaxID=2816474 RepID=UPI001A8EBB95|nr:T9SS type A sorting domain-containing protein [Hymenobacter telluris]
MNAATNIACWQQQTSLNFSATDLDGDELVYSLEQPLSGCNNPIGYLNYVTNGLINIGSTAAPCFAQVPGSPSYSAVFPIASFNLTGPACPATRSATPYFRFNATTGSFTFQPAIYDSQDLDRNKYVVVGKVSEYRRINNVRTLIGTVRREMLVIVTDCGTNRPPAVPVAVSNNLNSGAVIVNTVDSTFVQVSTCNATRVLIRFSDPNANDLLTVTVPNLIALTPSDPSYLPTDVGTFQITGNGTRQPVGVLNMQPDVAFAGITFRIPIQIRDNGCPVAGVQNRIIVLTIRNRSVGQITVAGVAGSAICAGSPATLTARALRPDSVIVPVPNPTTLLANFTYRWESANGLAPADQNSRVVTVNPTQTTRYIVHITTTNFRSAPIPTCVDTASVLVRVVATPPQPSIMEVGNELFSSAPVGNQWYFNGQPLAGATAASLVPPVPGSYTVVTSTIGTLPVCSSLPSLPYTVVLRGTGNVQISPNPTANGRFIVQLTGYEQPVVLTVFNTLGRQLTAITVAAPNPAGTTQALDLAGATAGVYVVRVVTAGSVKVQRVVRE